jgi:hypothetical protein
MQGAKMANYVEMDLGKVAELAAMGLSEEQIGASFGVSRRTIGRRKLEDEEFAQAFEQGRASLAVEVGSILLDHARNGSTDAAKFIADRRLGWQKETKNSLEVSAPHNFN